MTKCKECGSFAVNHHLHGRDGSDGDLCDVCYWRKRAQAPAAVDAHGTNDFYAVMLARSAEITAQYTRSAQAPAAEPLTDERTAFEAWAALEGFDWATGAGMWAFKAYQAGRAARAAHFADGENPCVLEWGAVSLPMGDSSRVTEMKLCPTLWAAIAEGALCGFDWRVYPQALTPAAKEKL